MASIHQDIRINVPVDEVWDAMRDLGALHTRLVVGFVLECQLEGEVRHLRFANGLQASERIVSVDPERRRVAWSATGARLTHHNASAQVFDEGDGACRVVWIADLLPHDMAPAVATMIGEGLKAMKRTLEALPQ
ncbi:SRPBCC family protein [Ideonella sp. YS5]|uniref:SRPBCC family protein n=1 Tax=Ideonella sp. YS5 TaxID=3453714 RepID=UPI003EEB7725